MMLQHWAQSVISPRSCVCFVLIQMARSEVDMAQMQMSDRFLPKPDNTFISFHTRKFTVLTFVLSCAHFLLHIYGMHSTEWSTDRPKMCGFIVFIGRWQRDDLPVSCWLQQWDGAESGWLTGGHYQGYSQWFSDAGHVRHYKTSDCVCSGQCCGTADS